MSQKAYRSGSTFPELKAGYLRLYSARICPYAERARLVLAHKNIPHEIVNIELADKPEWFLRIAPFTRVPVLQQDDKILFESTAISEYLDDVFEGEMLQAKDPFQKAKDRVLLEYFGQFTSSYYGALFSPRTKITNDEIDEKIAQLHKHFQFFEDELKTRGSSFFAGSKPGMIDYFLWPHLEIIPGLKKVFPKIQMSKEQFPKLIDWWETMTQVPAVKKEMFDADWHYQVFQMINSNKPYGDLGLTE